MTKDQTFLYRRFVVIGATGSGKSTLAKRLATELQVNYIELDALNWGPNWTAVGSEMLRARVEEATRAPAWAVAGNYSVTRAVTWPRAEAIVWLDYPLWVIFWRLFRRTWRRILYNEELWNGNRESAWTQLKLWSEESLFHWLFKTYWRRKREYEYLLSLPENAHLHVFHFKNPKQAQTWLGHLTA